MAVSKVGQQTQGLKTPHHQVLDVVRSNGTAAPKDLLARLDHLEREVKEMSKAPKTDKDGWRRFYDEVDQMRRELTMLLAAFNFEGGNFITIINNGDLDIYPFKLEANRQRKMLHVVYLPTKTITSTIGTQAP